MSLDHLKAVEAASSYYRQMIDSIADYEVIRLDQTGIVRSWNPGAQVLTQYTAEEIIGQPVTVFYTEEDIAGGQVDRELRTATAGGRYETEGWRVRKDGSQFWASVVLTAIRGQDGTVEGFVKVARDLSDLREQQLALRAVQQMV